MSKITNDGLTRSGTGCFIAVPIWQHWASKAVKVKAKTKKWNETERGQTDRRTDQRLTDLDGRWRSRRCSLGRWGPCVTTAYRWTGSNQTLCRRTDAPVQVTTTWPVTSPWRARDRRAHTSASDSATPLRVRHIPPDDTVTQLPLAEPLCRFVKYYHELYSFRNKP